MSEEQQPHTPILKPKEEAKYKTARRKVPANPEDHEPVLFKEGFHNKKINPPYLLFGLVILGLVLACWKMWMYGDVSHEQIQKNAAQEKLELTRGGQ